MFALMTLLVAWCGAVVAEDSIRNPIDAEAILGPEPDSHSFRRIASVPEQKIEEKLRAPDLKIEVLPQYGLKNLRLLGQGLAFNLPWVQTYGARMGVSGTDWHVSGGLHTSTYTGLPASVTPTQVTAFDWDVSGGMRVLGQKSFEVRLGYEVFSRSAQETTPQAIVTSYLAHGPCAFASTQWDAGSWNMAVHGKLSVPWYFHENNSVSGSYQFAIRSQVRWVATRMIGKHVRVGLGLEALFHVISFSGTGTRGTTDATELDLGLSVPAFVQYNF